MTAYLGKKLQKRLNRLHNVVDRGLLIGSAERREAFALLAEMEGFAREVNQCEVEAKWGPRRTEQELNP